MFLNTKGGAGASMLALNSAITVAKERPNEVLLVDLDMQFGVIEDYLNVQSSYGLADAIANVSDLDDVSLGGLVTKHESGLHVIGFKRDSSHENFEKASQISKLILFFVSATHTCLLIFLEVSTACLVRLSHQRPSYFWSLSRIW